MRVSLKGLHRVSRKLASGQVRVHHYAWRGGPRVEGQFGSPEFIANFVAATERRRTTSSAIFKSLVDAYRASPEFNSLREKTKRDYRRHLSTIEGEFRDLPLAALEEARVRAVFLKWRDSFSDRPRTADYLWTVLARVLSWAKGRGLVAVNPCSNPGRLYRVDRSDRVWSDKDIAAFNAVASQPLRDALQLGFWTGQREGDLLGLTWTAFDGKSLVLRQGKGGRRVIIPVAKPLLAVLRRRARRKQAVTILTSTRGTPWTESGFRSSWRKAAAKAGLSNLRYHDLRGTAVSRLAEAGCTEAEIATVTGHSLRNVSRILESYLHRSEELAVSAIAKVEANAVRTKL